MQLTAKNLEVCLFDKVKKGVNFTQKGVFYSKIEIFIVIFNEIIQETAFSHILSLPRSLLPPPQFSGLNTEQSLG